MPNRFLWLGLLWLSLPLQADELKIVDQQGLIRAQTQLQQPVQVRLQIDEGRSNQHPFSPQLVNLGNAGEVLPPREKKGVEYIFEAVPSGSWKVVLPGGENRLKRILIVR